jgi:CheY-like chemotaxis protein
MIAGFIGMPSPRATSEENKPIRLIFVDDDDDYREAATAEIVDLGFVVESFADGALMLASVADGLDADVIVLDWSLPTMSGIDLLSRLRREGILLPVLFLTGRSSHGRENLAFDRGALDFVDKSRGVPILAKAHPRHRQILQAAARARGRRNPTLRPPNAKAQGQPRLLGCNRRQPYRVRVQRRAAAGFECRQSRDLPRGLRLHT